MKILVATGLYPPESGGPATFAKLIEDELSKDDYVVTTVPFSSARKYPKIVRHVVYFFLLFKQSKDTDIILALDPISVGVPARILATLKRIPFVVRLGGDYAWEQGKQRFGVTCNLDDFAEQNRLPFTLRLLQRLQSKVVKSADKIIAPSEYLKSIITRWGVESNKIEVIYSVSYLGESDFKKTNSIDTNGNSPVLLSVSRLVPWKGFSTLIDVVDGLRKDFPNILLLIGGDGPEYDSLHHKITSQGLENNVKLLGLMGRAEIEATSQQVDMFLLNTEYEGFSHLLLEFMKFGVPIITTRVGGNTELIEHNETGYLVEYNDKEALKKAIVTLANNPAVRDKYTSNAKKRLDKFSQEESISRLKSLFNSVVSN